MSRVFAISCALSAILFVVLARPQEGYVEETTPAVAAPVEGGETTTSKPNPACEQYDKLCGGNATGAMPVPIGPITGYLPPGTPADGAMNMTSCPELAKKCPAAGGTPEVPGGVGGGNGTNPVPGGLPGGLPINTNDTIPAIPPVNTPMPMPMPIPAIPGIPGGRK